MSIAAAQSRDEDAPPPRLVFFARGTLFIERIAPILLLAGAPVAALMLFGLFGFWAAAPQWTHAFAILAALGLSASIAFRLRRDDIMPTRGEALTRLEADGRIRHDALQSLEDRPLAGAGPLWDAHLSAMRGQASRARLASARMTANSIDPRGVRYAALALFAIGWIAAGGDAGRRLIASFVPSDPRAAAAGYADLWIEPPAYTGKPPIYLLRASDALPGVHDSVDAPEGSVVRAQVNAKGRFRLALKTERGTLSGEKDGSEKSSRMKLTLAESGTISLRAGGREGRWPVAVIDDRAPTVAFIEPPKEDRDGRLALSATIDDDYGAVSAFLRLKLDPEQERPLDAPAFDLSATMEPRTIALDGFAGAGARAAAIDLQSDPWAGLKVEATLIVKDAAGQSGETARAFLTLPAKPFFNPLARAVVEQRQSLAVSPKEWRRVEWALSGVTLGPEYFFERPTDYLLLRTAMWRVNKEAGGDYRKTVADFWPLALQLENETLELARRRLEAAKEALKYALENGASNSEIEQLTEAMRAALQQYLQALAESGAPQDGPPADEVVSSADLDAMLDSIRDLAKSGAEDAARQALADLENLLDNLRLSARRGQGEGGGGRNGGAAGEAGDLIGRQRALADKSFERGQTRDAVGDDLGAEQGGLAGDLSDLMDSLGAEGTSRADPSGDAGRALSRALSDMRRSEEALKGEDFGAAGDAMERAIANLRDGAEKLAEGRRAQARAGRQGAGDVMRDPLGRPVGDPYGAGVEVPEKSDAQRSRELLLELRRRLSDGDRTEEEIDYLERLLRRF